MTIQHLNDARAIARTATNIGATLPEPITDALTHLEEIARDTPTMPNPGASARALAEHIGNRAKMEKELKLAVTALAAAEATGKIHTYLAETCGARIRGMMLARREEVAAAFGDALADDLATLTTTAVRLPEWFRPEGAADLDAAAFTAWTQARDAHARISIASAALTPLYAGAIGQENGEQFPTEAAAALRYAKPGNLSTAKDAYRFRGALAGRTERVQGMAGQGSTFVDGLFVPTVLAHAGATFEWATPVEVTKRAEQIVMGMVLKPEPVSTPAATSVVAF